MTLNPNPAMTLEAFEAFLKTPARGHDFWELVEGRLVERGNTQEQGMIASTLVYLLYRYSRERDKGRVSTSVWHHKAGDLYDVRMPKIAYSADDTRPLVNEGFVPVYPDLAVEIKALDEDDSASIDRGAFYLSHGTKIVWLIYPVRRSIDVMTNDNRPTLTSVDLLTGGDILPGFSVPVSEIFQLDPSES